MKILVLTSFTYREGLMQAYTLPYLRIIQEVAGPDCIYLVSQEKTDAALSDSETKQTQDLLSSEGISWIPTPYLPFGSSAIIAQQKLFKSLKELIKAQDISHIHVWGTPSGVMGYKLSKATGRPLIIDSYEPHAEAQLENGSWSTWSLGYQVLSYYERKMSRHARHLIYTTKNMIEYAKDRFDAYDPKEWVKPACVDLEHFSLSLKKDEKLISELGLHDKVVMVYAGKFGGIYYDREFFEFIKAAYAHWGCEFRALLLSSASPSEVLGHCNELDIPKEIVIHRFVDHSDIPRYMGLADFAISPVRPVPTKQCCTPIKDGEYWAMGLPVIIPKGISDDSDIIEEEKAGIVIEALTPEENRRAILRMEVLLGQESSEDLSTRIRGLAMKYRNFDIARDIYRALYA